MDQKRTIGIALLVAGLILLLGSLLADVIGYGSDPAFGPRQIMGCVGGAVAAVIGGVLMRGDSPQSQ